MDLAPSICGAGALHVGRVRGRSAILSCWSRSPLAMLAPRTNSSSVWAYTSSLGGGLVAGDQIRLNVGLDAGAACFLGTQSSTKIYRNPAQRPCSHYLHATLALDSLLVLAPDPVQCFAESAYEQTQVFDMAASANLILLDWISSGRAARGERWAFRRYSSRNRIFHEGRVAVMDSLLLDQQSAPLTNRFRAGRFNCLATLIIIGKKLQTIAAELLEEINNTPVARGADLVFAGSALAGGAIMRFAGISVEAVGRALRNQLKFVPALLEGDPWARKW